MKDDLTLRIPKGAELTLSEGDANFQRLMYWSGPWTAGTYEQHEVVTHQQNAWVCNVPTTTQEPTLDAFLAASSDWFPISINQWGFGELLLNVSSVRPDIGGTWQAFTNYDVAQYDQNTVLSAVNGTIQFKLAALWEVQFSFSMNHNNDQSGRTTELRAYNVTQTSGANPLPIGIGRNQVTTQVSSTFWLDATADDVWRIEIGNGDTISSVTLDSVRFAAKKMA